MRQAPVVRPSPPVRMPCPVAGAPERAGHPDRPLVVVHSGRLALAGLALMAAGLTPLLFGLWKMLTGSAVEVEAPDR